MNIAENEERFSHGGLVIPSTQYTLDHYLENRRFGREKSYSIDIEEAE